MAVSMIGYIPLASVSFGSGFTGKIAKKSSLREPLYVLSAPFISSPALKYPLYLAVVEWYVRFRKELFSVEQDKTSIKRNTQE
jgi:hypothetical protein